MIPRYQNPATISTLDGKRFDLAALKGKVVLVNFFATWCGPCLAEMPALEKQVWKQFKGESFAMIGTARGPAEDRRCLTSWPTPYWNPGPVFLIDGPRPHLVRIDFLGQSLLNKP